MAKATSAFSRSCPCMWFFFAVLEKHGFSAGRAKVCLQMVQGGAKAIGTNHVFSKVTLFREPTGPGITAVLDDSTSSHIGCCKYVEYDCWHSNYIPKWDFRALFLPWQKCLTHKLCAASRLSYDNVLVLFVNRSWYLLLQFFWGQINANFHPQSFFAMNMPLVSFCIHLSLLGSWVSIFLLETLFVSSSFAASWPGQMALKLSHPGFDIEHCEQLRCWFAKKPPSQKQKCETSTVTARRLWRWPTLWLKR